MGHFSLDVIRLCAWLILLLAIFIPLEKLFAVRPQKAFRKAFGTDLVYYFLNSLAPKLFLVIPMTILAVAVHRVVPSVYYSAVASLPLWLRLAAAMIVGEVGTYWAHRWSHEIPILWRFHAVHHSAEEIDFLVNTRAHPVDIVFTRLCDMVPMYILGLAQPMGNNLDVVPALVTIIGTMWGFFIHSNVNWRLGWFEWFISSPAFHHWHHANDGPERINRNYAPMLPWVDKIFGTLYLPQHWPEKYGIDAPISPNIGAQLLDPLLTQPPAYRFHDS
jgi:sterol desaturase/sphingolipid hydroxylase (fatty acid hydroxylase superfamily)